MPNTANKTSGRTRTNAAAHLDASPPSRAPRAGRTPARSSRSTRETIVDAAYAILQDEGVQGISTRRVAARADVNQALVHYHFGSLDALMVEVLGRIATSVIARTERHYAGDAPFSEKYRGDIDDLLKDDLRGGWGKVWLEALALSLNSPELLDAFLAEQRRSARKLVEADILQSMGRNDKEARADAEAMAAMIAMFRSGLVIDRLAGTSRGHRRAAELLSEFFDERIGQAASTTKAPTAKAPTAKAPTAKAPTTRARPAPARTR